MSIKQGADVLKAGGADMAGEQSVVADAMEALGEDVEQEAADELIDLEGDRPIAHTIAAIVLMPEGDLAAVVSDEARVGEGDTVGVAPEVLEYGLGA